MAITRLDIEYSGVEILQWDGTNETAKLFVEEFCKTPVGEQIVANGLKTTVNMEAILELAQKTNGHEDVGLKEFEVAAKQLFLAGDLQPKQEPVAQAPAPKALSSSQLAWQQFRDFTETHSVAECKARARVDEGYRKFLETNLRREIGSTPVGDACVSVGTTAVRQDTSIRRTEDLRAFADAYRRTATAEVKRLSSPLTNPLGHAQYVDLLDACIASGLI
jgi:hypothetical protein